MASPPFPSHAYSEVLEANLFNPGPQPRGVERPSFPCPMASRVGGLPEVLCWATGPERPHQSSEGGKRWRTSRHRADLPAAAILGPAAAMGSWALSAALLCLGGALAYGKLHSLTLREGSSPAQGQAAMPGPPEEEQPVTKGSIWSCAAPPPQHTGTLPAVPTSATQDSAAPRPLVAMSVIPQKCSALIF